MKKIFFSLLLALTVSPVMADYAGFIAKRMRERVKPWNEKEYSHKYEDEVLPGIKVPNGIPKVPSYRYEETMMKLNNWGESVGDGLDRLETSIRNGLNWLAESAKTAWNEGLTPAKTEPLGAHEKYKMMKGW
jgi:hypothetical protein